MISKKLHEKLYKDTVAILEKSSLTRGELINALLLRSGLSKEELSDNSVNGKKNVFRSRAGEVISEMLGGKTLIEGENGIYKLSYDKPAIIRIESCEREILRILTKAPKTRLQIRQELAKIFGTDKTPTKKDDGRLADFMSKILKRLTDASVISYNGTRYALTEQAAAKADNINELMNLKNDFLKKLHSKGGEFFERYFMNLLSKYLTKHGKRVTECYTTGGSDDGGIDGIVKTTDSLGFREIIMVQTKNRVVIASETDIRGFYGAVCANRGTRGIYATTSAFHEGARAFLDGIDECVGINGEKIFAMAVECLYGISKTDGRLKIDTRVI